MALVDRLNKSRRHDLYCAALTASAIYNVNRAEGTDAIGPDDIIGNPDKDTGPKRMTTEEMALLFTGVLAPMFGGEVTSGDN